MQEINPIKNAIVDLGNRGNALKDYLDFEIKNERLIEVLRELEDPEVWNDQDRAQALGKERGLLEGIVNTINNLESGLSDASELLEMAVEENDEESVDSVAEDIQVFEKQVAELEFRRMFSGEMDANNAFLDVQSGSGGTEAQDWASMIERMYLRWGESNGFKTELLEESQGEVAGIKSATIKFEGDYAYGWLRTETGVHRLVRKSPFDSGSRRHTSFASVFVSPEIDDDIDIDINPADLRTDVYRASGAGGQHVNKTESAIRITHIETNVVVQCQNDRSQHKNKASAMKMLKSRLYELQLEIQKAEKQGIAKSEIGWGHQIRSYVMQPYQQVKDTRSNIGYSNIDEILDGDLDKMIEDVLIAQNTK